MKEFLKNFASIDERRVSTLLLLLVALYIFGMYEYHQTGEITDNFLYWLGLNIGAVAGVNGFDSVKDVFNNKNKIKNDTNSNQDYSNKI